MKIPQRNREQIAAESIEQRVVAWHVYQKNLHAGMAEQDSIKDALLKALPKGTHGSTNRNRQLHLWKDHELWPPPETEPVQQRQISSCSQVGARQCDTPPNERLDAEILDKAKKVLMRDVFVAKRPTTTKGRESTLPTTMIAGRLPNDLVSELKALGGCMSHHLEKAVRLYLRVAKTE